MNDTLRKTNQTVTSAGDAWVICESKSRPGFKYYFNTLSGQSVWNLSPEEIEKAKKFTKLLPISELQKCPEPLTDPPMNLTLQNVPLRGSIEQTAKVLKNPVPHMVPLNLLNMNGLPELNRINPMVWNNPINGAVQPQPIIYVVAQPSFGISSGNTELIGQNVCDTIIDYARNENGAGTSSLNNEYQSTKNRYDFHKSRQQARFCRNQRQHTTDLRQKLIRKRTKSFTQEPNCHGSKQTVETGGYQNSFKNKSIPQVTLKDELSKYNLSVLEKLKPNSKSSGRWFVVVDTEIILDNFPFLNKLIDPEQKCYLLVPEHVMCELQEIVSAESDMAKRRILRFLNQQIESEIAFRGHEVRNAADDSYRMFATCEEFASEDNVILLSNNVRFEKFRYVHKNIHILRLDELKAILNDRNSDRPARLKSPTMAVKIVIPNDKHTSGENFKPLFMSADNINKTARTETATSTQSSKTETNLHPSSLIANNENKRSLKLSRDTANNPNIENPPQSRYRWRKLRIHNANPNSKTDDKKVSRQYKSAEEKITYNYEEAEKNVGDNSKNVNSPTPASSLVSSITSNPKRTEFPNIVIEETSTSGVLSNIESESVCSLQVQAKENVNINDEVTFTKYQVEGENMKEVLSMRREEWILRFVQIMEDTLREMLREDTKSKNCEYTSSWATDLPELSKCIIKKFSDHFHVVDAANRLSFQLHKISDSKGNFRANLNPQHFMDMYSYGVYLIRALKHVNGNCEDLTTADQSLEQLLCDINNASRGCDTYVDDVNEDHINPRTLPKLPRIPSPHWTPQGSDNVSHDTNKSYFLSKTSQKSNQPKTPNTNQRQIMNTETEISSSLPLTNRGSERSCNTPNTPSTTSNSARIIWTPPSVTVPQSPQIPTESTSNTRTALPEVSHKDTIPDPSKSEVKISFVRKFTNIAQFEDKLKKKGSDIGAMLTIHDEYVDFDPFEDYYEQYDGADDYNNDTYDQSELDENELENEDMTNEENDKKDTSLHINDLECDENVRNANFESFIKEYTAELKQPIKVVQKLCTKTIGEIKNGREPCTKRQADLRKAHDTLSNLKAKLCSILTRDSIENENNIKVLLKKANLEAYVPRENISEYIATTSECLKQINVWHKIVTQVMEAAGMQQLNIAR